MEKNKPVLFTEKLSIGYQSKRIAPKILLPPTDLSMAKGQLTCLLGRNGIGKSTLLKTITGHLMPLEGKVFVHEKNFNHLKPLQKAQLISWVNTQNLHIDHLRVEEYISYGRYPYTNWWGQIENEDQLIIDQAIEAVEVAHLRNKFLKDISDGEKQKVVISRSLAQNTPVMVLDEPSVHLDYSNKLFLFKLLKKLCKNLEKTILISTHELHLALEMSDQIWLMEDKKITQARPEDPSTKKMIQKAFDIGSFL